MPFYNYSLEFDSQKSARAQAYDQNVSYKDLTQVCAAIRGKPYEQALELLEDALVLRKPVFYRRHAKGAGHRPQLGGKRGRFPRGECKLAIALLKNAFASAQTKGLKEDALFVLSARAYKQNVYPRYRRFFVAGHTLGYGKQALFSNYSTARAEIVLGEKGLKPLAQKTKKERKLEAARKKAEKKAAAEQKREAAEKEELVAEEQRRGEAAEKKVREAEKPAAVQAAVQEKGVA